VIFGNGLRPGLAKHLVSQDCLEWCVPSAQDYGWWMFSLNYQTVGLRTNLHYFLKGLTLSLTAVF